MNFAFNADFPLLCDTHLTHVAYQMVQALLLASSRTRAESLTVEKVAALVQQWKKKCEAPSEFLKLSENFRW